MGVPICYVDESGGVEDPRSRSDATPLMVIAGVAFDHGDLLSLTREFLRLKRRFFPGKAPGAGKHLDQILAEVKGKELRMLLRSASRTKRRHAIGYLDKMLQLVAAHNGRLMGRVWIKAPGAPLDPRASYAYAIQDIARTFQNYLEQRDDVGLLVCDARMQNQNAEVAHSIFTQKHQFAGDALNRLVEVTTFGHSVNHAGLQMADLLASCVLFPMTARTYCLASSSSAAYVDPHFEALRLRFGTLIRGLQHRYQEADGRWRGGIVVSDAIGQRSGAAMFGLQPQLASPRA
jgi:hypothetical protein